MKLRFAIFYFLLALAAAMPGPVLAEDHAPGAPVGGRPTVDPAAYQNRLYQLIGACLQGRPGDNRAAAVLAALGSPTGVANGVNGGSNGAAIYQMRCFGCHGQKDPQTSIACMQGNCNAKLPNGQIARVMPPTGPLSVAEQQAITTFLQTGQ